MDDFVVYEQDDGIVTITLNRPESRNAMFEGGIIDGLVSALDRLNDDAEARVAILTGAGKTFSAGADLRKFADPGGLADRPVNDVREFYRRGIQRVPFAFERLEVPIIAAVNGAAMGGGCDIACMCDMRIAAESALFGEVFVKIGCPSGDAGAWFIQRLIGPARFAEMAFTGESFTAAQALQMGLVSQVVADAALADAARALARRVAANAPLALRMTKRLMRDAQTSRLGDHLELSATFMAICHGTEDHREALNAFFEKRTPRFRGR